MASANTHNRTIDVQGAQLYAETRSGTAPALVFLHYWGGSRRTWHPVLTRLRPDQAFRGLRPARLGRLCERARTV